MGRLCAPAGFHHVWRAGPLIILLQKPSDLLCSPSGAVVGSLFHRHGSARALTQNGQDSSGAASQVEIDQLLHRYWGSYVAVARQKDGIIVQPDPVGTMPCYYHDHGDYVAFASEPAILQDAAILSISIDWQALGRHLVYYELPFAETALLGVRRLVPGTAAVVEPMGVLERPTWSPWPFVDPAPNPHQDSDAERLERVIRHCVGGMVSLYPQSLFSISGGLDSSILAAAAAGRSAVPPACLTLFTDDPLGDERDYARCLADHLGSGLIEERYRMEDVDIGRSASAHKGIPSGRAPSLAYNAALRRAAAVTGAQAIMMGAGGDNIFFHHQSTRPVVDRLRSEGAGLGVFRTLLDISAATQSSVFTAGRQALRFAFRRWPAYGWRPHSLYMADDASQSIAADPPSHSWLAAPAHGLPGKAAHVAMILRIHNHLDMLDRADGLAVLNPLMAQPIVELCLSIPSWKWIEAGSNRAPARKAFAAHLPQKILDRRLKGGPDAFAGEILARHAVEARQRILDGHLLVQAILDRRRLEQDLGDDLGRRSPHFVRLLHILDTEAWIGHWQARSPKAATGGMGALQAVETSAWGGVQPS